MKSYFLIVFCCMLSGIAKGQFSQRKMLSFSLKGYDVHMSSDIQNKKRQIKDASFNGNSSLNTYFESIQLNGTGSIYHPNLMFYSLTMGLGLNQNINTQTFATSRKTKSNNLFNDIGFQSIWLGTKPYNFLFGYNKKYRKQNSNFFDDSVNRTKRWYSNGNWRTPEFRLNVELGQNDRDEEYGDRVITIDESNSGLRGSWGTMESINGSANLNRRRVFREEKNVYNSDIINTIFQVSNSLPLKNKGKTQLFSSLFANSIKSSEDITSVNITNRANYEWSRTLRSDLSYFFTYNEIQEKVNRNHSISANTNHQLYASLSTSLTFQQDYYIEGQYQQRNTDFSGNWKYSKKLPQGRLFIDYAFNPHWENIHSDNPLRRWVEDIYSFDAFDRIVLRDKNIVTVSVEIYNATGIVQYFQDLDYSILVFDNRVEIQKTPLTAIPDTASVLIRYEWQARKNESSSSIAKQFGIRYEYQSFWSINIGYKQSSIFYPKQKWTTLTTEDNRLDNSYFMSVEYPPVKLTTDFTKANSSITPYERLDIGLSTILGSFLTQYISLNVQHSAEYLPLKNDRQTNMILTIEAFRRLSRAIKIKAGFSQKEIDGKHNQLFEKRIQAVIKFENRRLELTGSFEHLQSHIFKETELDQQWKIQLDIKS